MDPLAAKYIGAGIAAIGMGGAGVGNRHQRPVEGGDGDIARRRQHGIAGQAHEADNGAHDDKGAEDARADAGPGQREFSQNPRLGWMTRQCDGPGFMPD